MINSFNFHLPIFFRTATERALFERLFFCHTLHSLIADRGCPLILICGYQIFVVPVPRYVFFVNLLHPHFFYLYLVTVRNLTTYTIYHSGIENNMRMFIPKIRRIIIITTTIIIIGTTARYMSPRFDYLLSLNIADSIFKLGFILVGAENPRFSNLGMNATPSTLTLLNAARNILRVGMDSFSNAS